MPQSQEKKAAKKAAKKAGKQGTSSGAEIPAGQGSSSTQQNTATEPATAQQGAQTTPEAPQAPSAAPPPAAPAAETAAGSAPPSQPPASSSAFDGRGHTTILSTAGESSPSRGFEPLLGGPPQAPAFGQSQQQGYPPFSFSRSFRPSTTNNSEMEQLELEEDLAARDRELEALKKFNSNLLKDLAEHRSSLKNKDEQLSKLETNLQEEQTAKAKAEADLQTTRNNLRTSRADTDAAIKDKNEVFSSMVESQDEAKKYREERDALKQECKELDKTKAELASQIDELKEANELLNSYSQGAEEMNKSIDVAQDKLATLRTLYLDKCNENKNLKDELKKASSYSGHTRRVSNSSLRSSNAVNLHDEIGSDADSEVAADDAGDDDAGEETLKLDKESMRAALQKQAQAHNIERPSTASTTASSESPSTPPPSDTTSTTATPKALASFTSKDKADSASGHPFPPPQLPTFTLQPAMVDSSTTMDSDVTKPLTDIEEPAKKHTESLSESPVPAGTSTETPLSTYESKGTSTDDLPPITPNTKDSGTSTNDLLPPKPTTQDQGTSTDNLPLPKPTTKDQGTSTADLPPPTPTTQDRDTSTNDLPTPPPTTQDRGTSTDDLPPLKPPSEDRGTSTDDPFPLPPKNYTSTGTNTDDAITRTPMVDISTSTSDNFALVPLNTTSQGTSNPVNDPLLQRPKTYRDSATQVNFAENEYLRGPNPELTMDTTWIIRHLYTIKHVRHPRQVLSDSYNRRLLRENGLKVKDETESLVAYDAAQEDEIVPVLSIALPEVTDYVQFLVPLAMALLLLFCWFCYFVSEYRSLRAFRDAFVTANTPTRLSRALHSPGASTGYASATGSQYGFDMPPDGGIMDMLLHWTMSLLLGEDGMAKAQFIVAGWLGIALGSSHGG